MAVLGFLGAGIRRTAGIAKAPRERDPARYDAVHAHCDLLVVGGGPAGLLAAQVASRAGLRVMLAEQDFECGGRLLATNTLINDAPVITWFASVLGELAASRNVTLLTATTCFGLYDHGMAGLLQRLDLGNKPSAVRQRYWRVHASKPCSQPGRSSSRSSSSPVLRRIRTMRRALRGGSSSGSAAAVAAGMIPVALATQTTGSIIRPAAFCGVVGYKPSYGTLPCVGAKAISESFDTVGVMARTVADAALLVGALSGRALELPPEPTTPRLGICLTHEWPAALPETAALFDALPRLLERAGARPTLRALPDVFIGLAEAQSTIWTFEIARCLADEHRRFRELIREPLRGMLDEGAAMPIAEYDESLRRLRECRAALAAVFDGLDVLVVPAAPGEAPDVATTGDPIFNRVWSALGAPAMTVPAGAGPSGLPLGVQVVGLPGQDARVVACAAWIERALGGAAQSTSPTTRYTDITVAESGALRTFPPAPES